MLPTGHIAAGYLLAKSILAINQPSFDPNEQALLGLIGGFSGFAPDLDMFYAFIKERGFHQTGLKFNHREFITHTPIFWLVISTVVALVGRDFFWRYIAVAIFVGSWSHLILDSTFVGIRWLYPFSKKFYALKNPGQAEPNLVKGFFNHWFNLVKMYYHTTPLTFLAEIILVIVAVIIAFS